MTSETLAWLVVAAMGIFVGIQLGCVVRAVIEDRRKRMTRAELRAACPSDDTGGYIEWLEARVLELIADEAPRKMAERIIQSHLNDSSLDNEDLAQQITTAIQAASNAQLERGRRAVEAWRELERDKHSHVSHVREFMEKFQQHIGEAPGFPPQDVVEAKLRRVTEEFCELIAACGYKPHVQISDAAGEWVIEEEITTGFDTVPDLPHAVREAIDLEYSTHHLMISCGVDTAEPWARVCAANMCKELRDGKPVKPEGWQAPDIAGALKDQGWGGGE